MAENEFPGRPSDSYGQSPYDHTPEALTRRTTVEQPAPVRSPRTPARKRAVARANISHLRTRSRARNSSNLMEQCPRSAH